MRFPHSSMIVLALLTVVSTASADTWVNYTAGDNPTVAICEGERYVWVGSDGGGVARFDIETGEKTVYTSADGLCGNQVYSIAIDTNGDKWFGTGDGASVLRADGSWTAYYMEDDYVSQIVIEDNGNKWFRTYRSGVWLMTRDGTLRNFRPPSEYYHVVQIFIDNGGRKWFLTTRSGAWVLELGGKWVNYNAQNSGLPSDYVFLIVEDLDGTMWFASSLWSMLPEDWGVCALHPDGSWSHYTAENSPLASDEINHMAIDANGNKWLAVGRNGVSVLHPDGSWTQYNTMDSGLASDGVGQIIADSDGSIWFMHWGKGISILRPDGSWTHYNTENSGLPDDRIEYLATDQRGNKWFSPFSKGVSVLRPDGSWLTFKTGNSGLLADHAPKLAVDHRGTIWCGHEFQGASALSSDGSWATHTPEDSGLLNRFVSSVTIGPENSIWFGHEGGVSILHPNGNWSSYGLESITSLWAPRFSSIAFDHDGTIWLATCGSGVFAIGPDGRSIILTPNNSPLLWAPFVAIDDESSKWFAGRGVHKLDAEGQWTSYTQDDSGPLGEYITCMKIDGKGRKWFGSREGVSVLDNNGLWISYTAQQMGFSGENLVGDIAFDDDGSTWCVTISSGVRLLSADGEWSSYTSGNSGLATDEVASIVIDSQGRKWFGSYFGGVSVLIED